MYNEEIDGYVTDKGFDVDAYNSSAKTSSIQNQKDIVNLIYAINNII